MRMKTDPRSTEVSAYLLRPLRTFEEAQADIALARAYGSAARWISSIGLRCSHAACASAAVAPRSAIPVRSPL